MRAVVTGGAGLIGSHLIESHLIESLIATGDSVVCVASDLTGIRRRTVALPASVAMLVAGAAEWWGRVGGTPFITRNWVRVFLEDRRADIGPARADLGYTPRGLREGLTETFARLRTTGVLPP